MTSSHRYEIWKSDGNLFNLYDEEEWFSAMSDAHAMANVRLVDVKTGETLDHLNLPMPKLWERRP